MAEAMTESLVHEVTWNLDYRFRVGKAWSRFLVGLRDDRTILGTRCASCARTFVPPLLYCEGCFEQMDDWVEVPPEGSLHAATVTYLPFLGGPEAPFAVGALRLDGTDTLFLHLLAGFDLDDTASHATVLARDTRWRAVWSPERSATIRDISHFEPIPTG